MKKSILAIVCLMALCSSAMSEELKSIRDFSYKGISFSSSLDDLKNKGYLCQQKTCSMIDDSFTYHPSGIFGVDVDARSGKEVIFHESYPLKITIDQLYPDTGEQCSNIIKDLQTRFNAKYNADIKFKTYPVRYGVGIDYDVLVGAVTLGEDVLRVNFSCKKVIKPTTAESLTFVHALFNYENLASRLLIDDI